MFWPKTAECRRLMLMPGYYFCLQSQYTWVTVLFRTCLASWFSWNQIVCLDVLQNCSSFCINFFGSRFGSIQTSIWILEKSCCSFITSSGSCRIPDQEQSRFFITCIMLHLPFLSKLFTLSAKPFRTSELPSLELYHIQYQKHIVYKTSKQSLNLKFKINV